MTKHFCPCPSGRETTVKRILEWLGFTVELPTRPRTFRRSLTSKQRKAQHVAILPGFVIVQFDGTKRILWQAMITIGLIRRGRTFEVTDEDIRRIQSRFDAMQRIANEVRIYKPGEIVTLPDKGPFAGQSITIKEVRKKTIKGYVGKALVEIPVAALEAA